MAKQRQFAHFCALYKHKPVVCSVRSSAITSFCWRIHVASSLDLAFEFTASEIRAPVVKSCTAVARRPPHLAEAVAPCGFFAQSRVSPAALGWVVSRQERPVHVCPQPAILTAAESRRPLGKLFSLCATTTLTSAPFG